MKGNSLFTIDSGPRRWVGVGRTEIRKGTVPGRTTAASHGPSSAALGGVHDRLGCDLVGLVKLHRHLVVGAVMAHMVTAVARLGVGVQGILLHLGDSCG